MSVAGLLRCVLKGYELEDPNRDDSVCEGGILLTSTIDFSRPAEQLKAEGDKDHRGRSVQNKNARTLAMYRCPIAGCSKIFKMGRSGWDSHVASLNTHSTWHPGVTNPKERKRLFMEEFPNW